MIKLFNYADRSVRPAYRWPFVYLHGAAESHNVRHAASRDLKDDAASDVFMSDTPMPLQPGEYPAELYGLRVVIVLANKYGDGLNGRVASLADEAGLQHARNVDAWR